MSEHPETTPEEAKAQGDGAVLRTLAPALRNLERTLRNWLGGSHRYPLSTMTRATIEGLANDLHRKADDLDKEQPLLTIMLMGGTGVGKSTLLNALAGGHEGIAQASFTRPTTRDPVVYYHESLRPDRFDPALRHCRLAPHDRPTLEQKIIVDTPDLDSNDLANREKMMEIMPVADIVLYVGSQEKYHDKLGWEIFLKQRKRRAFAFVLNKWDRCLHAGGTGVSPDQDLLSDLESEGFKDPLLFRTCAQRWVDFHKNSNGEGGAPEGLPEGEQFDQLTRWLELGITRMEIEAIKARGVGQLLQAVKEALTQAAPPDLTEQARKTRKAWERNLKEEAERSAEILVQTLEPNHREIEHHFALEGQRQFKGIMAIYLNLFNKLRYMGSTLRDHIPMVPKSDKDAVPAAMDLSTFTRACSEAAAGRSLDARTKALSNRLLVEADNNGFPVHILNDQVEATTHQDWRARYSETLLEALTEVERRWTQPKGARRVVQAIVVNLANWLPPILMAGAGVRLLWLIFGEDNYNPALSDLLYLLLAPFVAAVLCHLLIVLFLPMRWSAIRNEFADQLEEHLKRELNATYAGLPMAVAEELERERKRIEEIQAETDEVAKWLEKCEEAATIAGLYGR